MNKTDKFFDAVITSARTEEAKERVYNKITSAGKEDNLDPRVVLAFTCSVALFTAAVMFNPSPAKDFKGEGGLTQAEFYAELHKKALRDYHG